MTNEEAIKALETIKDSITVYHMQDVTRDAIKAGIAALKKQLQYSWHTSEEENAFGQQLVPSIGEPVIIMREFTNIKSGATHKEYDCGYLNEDWEIETEDGGWICDWQDVDAWKYVDKI